MIHIRLNNFETIIKLLYEILPKQEIGYYK